MAWAIASAKNNEQDESSDEYLLLNLMICQEKDVGDEYIAKRYDMNMLLRNIAGDGGLHLVTEAFFGWGMKAINAVARELTADDIVDKGNTALSRAKKSNTESRQFEVRVWADLQKVTNAQSKT